MTTPQKSPQKALVLGIDPGENTGIAVYRDGKLKQLLTTAPDEVRDEIACFLASAEVEGMKLQVVFEDSRKQSHIFSAKQSMNAAQKMRVARSVGMIDAWCVLIERACKRLGVQCLGVSPAEKGPKCAASAFEHITGWEGRTNEHERDAAMLARPFRKGFAV